MSIHESETLTICPACKQQELPIARKDVDATCCYNCEVVIKWPSMEIESSPCIEGVREKKQPNPLAWEPRHSQVKIAGQSEIEKTMYTIALAKKISERLLGVCKELGGALTDLKKITDKL